MDKSQKSLLSRVLYKGECIDSNDPLGLGRIRAILKTETVADRESSVNYTPWDEKDPFIFKPLLPFFFNSPPKVGEYIHIIYANSSNKGSNDKYYIGGVYSSPTTSKFESYNSAITNLSEGSRNKRFQKLYNELGVPFNPKTFGVYARPEDVAYYGRGSADIIIKENELLLRAGKYNDFKRRQIPTANDKRAFLQLSKFDTKTEINQSEEYYRVEELNKNVKLLLEYNISNLENTQDRFTGFINIYTLKPNTNTSTENIAVDSDLSDYISILTRIRFDTTPLTKETTISLINDTIKNLSKGSLIPLALDSRYSGISIEGAKTINDRFPIYFRPQTSLYRIGNSLNQTVSTREIQNAEDIIGGVKYKTNSDNIGNGIIYDTGVENVPSRLVKESLERKRTNLEDNTASVQGGDYVFLLSHLSERQGTGKVNMTDTVYGISEERVAQDLLPKTASTVRGEELIELLDLIVRFLVSHVHPFPGMAAVPQALDGTRTDQLLTELLNANNKILNKYIRIN